MACLSRCNEKYCSLLKFLPNWLLSRGSSLPSFFMIVYFAKAVVLGFFRFLLLSFHKTVDQILVMTLPILLQFAILVEFVNLVLFSISLHISVSSFH